MLNEQGIGHAIQHIRCNPTHVNNKVQTGSYKALTNYWRLVVTISKNKRRCRNWWWINMMVFEEYFGLRQGVNKELVRPAILASHLNSMIIIGSSNGVSLIFPEQIPVNRPFTTNFSNVWINIQVNIFSKCNLLMWSAQLRTIKAEFFVQRKCNVCLKFICVNSIQTSSSNLHIIIDCNHGSMLPAEQNATKFTCSYQAIIIYYVYAVVCTGAH